MSALWCLLQRFSILGKSEGFGGISTGSPFGRSRPSIFGTDGTKCAPHWRHIELLAAAYSICLKPQCGQSTLILAGKGLATGSQLRNGSCATYARAPKAVLAGGVDDSSFRTISGLAGVLPLLAVLLLVTSDLPINVAPSSMTS